MMRDSCLDKWQGNFVRGLLKEAEYFSIYPQSNVYFNIPPLTQHIKSTKIKVALEISGQMRNTIKDLQLNIDSLLSSLNRQDINVDIFLSTWKSTSLKLRGGVVLQLKRYLGNRVFYSCPEELRRDWIKQFPNTNQFMEEQDAIFMEYHKEDFSKYIDIEDSCIILDEEKSVIDNILPDSFSIMNRTRLNQALMFYKIQSCHRLASLHGSYDVVIRMRPDLNICVPNLEECIVKANEKKNLVFVHYLNYLGIGDQFAVLSKQAMDIYADIYQKICSTSKTQYDDILEPNIGGESLLEQHLCLAGCNFCVIPSVRGEGLSNLTYSDYFDLSEYLKKDLEQGYSKEKELFVQTYLDIKTNGAM